MLKNYQKIRSDPLKLVLTILQALISLWVTGIGLFLYSDQHYFFWPPDWSNVENDIRIDTFIVLVGLVLFLCTIFGLRNRKIIAILLVCSGAISLSMATLSLLHVVMSSYWVMGLNVIGELILFSLVLLVAHYLQEVGRLQDLSNLLLAISALIGSISTFYQIIAKTKHNAPPDKSDMSVDDIQNKIKKLQKKLKEDKHD